MQVKTVYVSKSRECYKVLLVKKIVLIFYKFQSTVALIVFPIFERCY